MKVILLAGGFGTRLSEETEVRPKPMVEIGGRPILWHIMKIYSYYGFNEFIIALGYKADYIKKYFLDYTSHSGNLTVSIKNGFSEITQREQDEWIIHLEETGLDTMTGGRIKSLSNWVKDEPFMVTYGDGVADINIADLIGYHKKMGKLATITAVRPPARFGGLQMEEGLVKKFTEKPQSGEGWINGGFIVFEPEVLNLIRDSKSSLESELLEELAEMGQLAAYNHYGFWQCMDTLRDLKYLESLWVAGNAAWKVW
ncbi:MAG TPA: glucose-1-phosphate cytidylyltransferase [Legionellales bacterium]|nr:glucose-1-phosphate cytidylyltransferase [Legionellales bacterium]